jgi:hypothetical protein
MAGHYEVVKVPTVAALTRQVSPRQHLVPRSDCSLETIGPANAAHQGMLEGQRVSVTMVPPAGIEPALAAYLALTGYKSAALPIELRGRDRCDHADIRK